MNKYKVPAKQWKVWSKPARDVFNRVYSFVYDNPSLMTHPKQEPVKPAHWKTIAWNASWIAADAVDNTVTGGSACASPENFNAEIGRKVSKQNARDKRWSLLGYELRSKIHEAAVEAAVKAACEIACEGG